MQADQRTIFGSMLNGSTTVGARLRGTSPRKTAVCAICKKKKK